MTVWIHKDDGTPCMFGAGYCSSYGCDEIKPADSCGAVAPTGVYQCTLPDGHDGWHVAGRGESRWLA